MPQTSEAHASQAYAPNWVIEDVLRLEREAAEQERRVQTEQAALRHIWKQAKDAGLPTDVIKAVVKLRKRDPAEAELWVNQFLRIGAANGIVGPQTTMFAQEGFGPTDEQQRMLNIQIAEDLGFKAGKGGMGKDRNPYDVGTEESLVWVKWWGNGVAAAKHANGGSGPVPATKEQPRARRRATVEVKALEAPEEQPEEQPAEVVEVIPPVRVAAWATPAKKRGRPRKAVGGANGAQQKRGRGRPKGSLNKPKPGRQPTA